MTELNVSKRIINELIVKLQIKQIEIDYLKNNLSEQDLYKFTHELKRCPEFFDKKELEQMIRTLVKLTHNRYLSADEISELLNVEKSEVLKLYIN